ncbi:MAG TPA: hypothetical protein VF170_08430, partial [Planctomycetaceae bacterium]
MLKWLIRGVGLLAVLVLLGVLGVMKWNERLARDDLAKAAVPVPTAVPPSPLDDVLVLTPPTRDKRPGGMLRRELFRQALLIAGRDGLGLRTRDPSLREVDRDADPESLAATSADVDATDGGYVLDLKRQPRGKARVTLRYEIALDPAAGLTEIASRAEAASREDMPRLLEQLGYPARREADGKQGAERGGPAAADPGPELVERFDLVSQFAAVRAWHAAIRAGGETPERLAGLSRAYANLGFLAERHWSPASRVYHARSLLYAERLLRRTGGTPESYRVRAYARSLTGLPAAALEDLAR